MHAKHSHEVWERSSLTFENMISVKRHACVSIYIYIYIYIYVYPVPFSFTYIPVVNFLGEVAVLGLLVLTLFASAVCYLGVVAVLGMLIHALFVYASLMIQL